MNTDRRPVPSLRMCAAKPIARGCVPVAGFEALCARPNAAWGSAEWEQAAKTTVSTWYALRLPCFERASAAQRGDTEREAVMMASVCAGGVPSWARRRTNFG
jgi:hypothetical protein